MHARPAQIIELMREVFTLPGGKAVMAMGLLISAGLFEGFSLILLVPILAAAMGQTGVFRPFDTVMGWLNLNPASLGVGGILLIFVVVTACQVSLTRFKNVAVGQVLYEQIRFKRLQVFESLGAARWRVTARHGAARINQLLTAEIERVGTTAVSMMGLLQTIFMLGIYICLSAAISLEMTAFACVMGVATFAAMSSVRRRAVRHGDDVLSRHAEQHVTIASFTAGLKVAKSYNAEQSFVTRLRETLNSLRDETTVFMIKAGAMDATVQVANVAALALFLFVAVEYRNMPLPQLIVMILVFMRVAPRFNAAQMELQQLMMNLPSRLKVQRLLRECEDAREVEAGAGELVVRPCPLVTVWNVSFRYDDASDVWALRNVTFRIPAGKVTAMIGPSGGGKSTLADMIIGLIEPQRGYIFSDEQLVSAGGAKDWRRHVAYVQQDLFLFSGSLRANILLSEPGAGDDDIWEALERSGAAEFVRRLPNGLDTLVGDGGMALSVGQRQRISLARALIRKPSLLVLDEATSALDWENQRFVADTIHRLRGRMTILTIAHRPSMIAFSDHIVALENGEVVEEGAFSALRSDPLSRLSRMLAGEMVE